MARLVRQHEGDLIEAGLSEAGGSVERYGESASVRDAAEASRPGKRRGARRLRRTLVRLVSAVRRRHGENAPEDCCRRRAWSEEGHIGADGGEKTGRSAGVDQVADMGVEAGS